ncbi:MAG: PaaI family thioesterase [Hahellaceae bacterium]|nr:PaaI family thioesterase [Hahellaceae bacterium]
MLLNRTVVVNLLSLLPGVFPATAKCDARGRGVLTAKEVETIIREGAPMARDIDLTVEKIGAGGARVRVPFNARNVRPGGTLSGPVMMALADAAMYAAILGALGKVEMAVTSNLNINFLQKPAPADLVADALVMKMGRRLAFCEVRVMSDRHDGLVAHVTGSYALPSFGTKEQLD